MRSCALGVVAGTLRGLCLQNRRMLHGEHDLVMVALGTLRRANEEVSIWNRRYIIGVVTFFACPGDVNIICGQVSHIN